MVARFASYNDNGYYSDANLVTHKTGDWVKYSSHQRAIRKSEKEITHYVGRLIDANNKIDKLNATVEKYEAGEKPWDSVTGEDYND